MTGFGAVMHPYSQAGWRCQAGYKACRLLNHLPATRLTATALEAFLRVAGFALWRAYRGQFVKLLHLVDQSFLAALQQVLRRFRAVHSLLI